MRKYLRFPGFKSKAVTLSYDDGQITDRKLVEILVKHGMKGTFNLVSGCMTGDSPKHIGVEEAKALYLKNGMEIAVHGETHGFWVREPEIDGILDVINDRKNHERNFGIIVRGMAYPNGSNSISNELVKDMAKIGLAYGRATTSTHRFDLPENWFCFSPTCHHNDEKLDELVDIFLKKNPDCDYYKYPALFYLWGHSYEFNNDNNWETIEKFCKQVSNRQDTWYATNIEICDYVNASRKLVYNVENTKVYNPTAIDIYMSFDGKKVVIPTGKTIEI